MQLQTWLLCLLWKCLTGPHAAPFAVFLVYVWVFLVGGGGGGGGKGDAPHACGGNFAIPVTWAGNVHVWF